MLSLSVGLEIKTDDIAVLGYVGAQLIDIAPGVAGDGGIWQREIVEQRLTALINPTERNYVTGELNASERVNDDWRCSSRISRLGEITYRVPAP